ncbi:MAG: hypothetical protein AMXMBFR84_41010 [Candidatus Hydrogenedentota bacterium]
MRAIKVLGIVLLVVVSTPMLLIAAAGLTNGRTGVPTQFQGSAMLANPPSAWTEASTVKVVTYNVHDLKVVSDHRPERMAAIAEWLVGLDPDIVGFQEAFIESDRAILEGGLIKSRLKHFQYYPSGTVGSGLFVASAYPIRETWFCRYTASNPWYRLDEGDWWAGKGVALARIETPGGLLDFFNTHAQAGYGNPAYKLVREQQMADLAAFVTGSRVDTVPALLVGDMNCRIGDKDFTIAEQGAGLVRLMTMDSHIDHVFGVKDARYAFEVLDTVKIEGEIDVEGGKSELSDHPGYMSTIRITPVAP